MTKEYIERDALLRYLADLQLAYYAEKGKEREYAVMDAVFDAVAKVPAAADVVEVVRCGECRTCDPETMHCDHSMGTTFPFSRKKTDFCSYGERRGE